MKWHPTALEATNCLKDLSLFGIVTAAAVQLLFNVGVLIITIITTNVNITGTDWNLNIGRAVTFPEFQYPNLNSQDGDAEVKRNKLLTDSTHLNKLQGTWVGLSWFVLASGLIGFPINVVTFSVS